MIEPSELPKRPVTALVMASALGVTLWLWSGRSIAALTLSLAWPREPWRLFTSALPHLDILHLAFNLVWTAVFGLAIERHYGSARTALLYAFVTATSGLAELALFRGGVGLSGLGYGLFGFLWTCRRLGHPLGSAIDPQTVRLFIAWFFLCLVLTMTGTWRIANVAHGMGAVAGIVAARAALRGGTPWLVLGGALVVVTAALAGPLRPLVNLGSYRL